MITRAAIPNLLGNIAYDVSHDKIGKIGHVYVDDRTGEPEWMTVQTGKPGSRETFIPLQPAQLHGNEIDVPFSKDQIANAPNVDAVSAGHLSEQDEAVMYDFYGLTHPTMPTDTTSRTDDAITRSEEQLRVGKESAEAGRVHLRKYAVTEDQSAGGQVRKERIEAQGLRDDEGR